VITEGRPSLVVVDTSVWVAYFRGREPNVEVGLDRLIDEDRVAIVSPVRLELILGARRSQRHALVRQIDALHLLPMTEQTWSRAEDLAMDMRNEGITAGVVDLLIAVTAAENGALLWTLDKDFDPLIKKKYVRAFVPI